MKPAIWLEPQLFCLDKAFNYILSNSFIDKKITLVRSLIASRVHQVSVQALLTSFVWINIAVSWNNGVVRRCRCTRSEAPANLALALFANFV